MVLKSFPWQGKVDSPASGGGDGRGRVWETEEY